MMEKDILLRQLAREKCARKEAESILKEKNAMLYNMYAILDATADSIVVFNEKNCVEIFNKAASQLFGYENDALKGKPIQDLFTHVVPSRFGEPAISLESIPVHLQENVLYEVNALREDKSPILIELTLSKTTVAGKLLTICVLRNIFERKQAEVYLDMEHAVTRALAESTRLEEVASKILQILCDAMRMAVGGLWTVDDTHDVLRVSTLWHTEDTPALKEFTQTCKEFSFPRGEGFPGKIWEEKGVCWIEDVVIDPHFPRAAWVLKANLHSAIGFPIFFEGKVIGVVEFFMHHLHLQQRNEKLVVTLNDIGNQLGVFIGREKAQQKVFEELESIKSIESLVAEYKKSKEQAESANKMKAEFLANMSHELRTPLNAVIGYGQMIQEDTDNLEQKDYCEKVIYAAKHLLNLINDVLDLSRIEAGKMDLFLENISVEDLVGGLKTFADHLVKINNNTFQLIMPPDIGIMYTDVIRARQSLLNLISNARKFTHNGTITLEVKLLLRDNKEWVQFSVIDTGIGIPAEKIGKLFQAFSQVDPSTTRKYSGTGLGLYLTQRFCEMLGGWVTVESKENEGSTFSIILPLKSSVSLEKTNLSENILFLNKPSILEEKTVLVVDDDRKFHREIQTHLEKIGYVVLHAFDGEEGLRWARKYRPSVIILDVIMPVMDGWATLSALKADAILSTIPVIITSVISEEDLSFALGAIDYLHKPIHSEMLVSKVKQLTLEGEHPVILMIDEDTAGRKSLTKAIKKVGWNVVEVANGAEAIACLAQSQPAVILVDLMMTEKEGFTILKEMQKNEKWRKIPLIVLTAKELSHEQRTMLMTHSTSILRKEYYSCKELITTIGKQMKMAAVQ